MMNYILLAAWLVPVSVYSRIWLLNTAESFVIDLKSVVVVYHETTQGYCTLDMIDDSKGRRKKGIFLLQNFFIERRTERKVISIKAG